MPLTLPWDETFDIASDTGTPVDDKDYSAPFTFTGRIDKLTSRSMNRSLHAGPSTAARRRSAAGRAGRRGCSRNGRAATPTLQIAGSDVVEHQRAVLEMTPGQPPLDRRLRRTEEIEGTVELVFVHLAQPQHRAQRMRSRGLCQAAAPSPASPPAQPRGRRSAPGPALRKPLRPARQQPVETLTLPRAGHRGNVTMRQLTARSHTDQPPSARNVSPRSTRRAPRPWPPASRVEVGRACGFLTLPPSRQFSRKQHGGRRRAVRHARDVHKPYRSC